VQNTQASHRHDAYGDCSDCYRAKRDRTDSEYAYSCAAIFIRGDHTRFLRHNFIPLI
jgi:hypothetical protein